MNRIAAVLAVAMVVTLAGAISDTDRASPSVHALKAIASPQAPDSGTALAPLEQRAITGEIARNEPDGELLLGNYQLSPLLLTVAGESTAVRVLSIYLRVEREPRGDGPVFLFPQQELVRAADAAPVLTGRAGGYAVDEAGKRTPYAYQYEFRPRDGLSWADVTSASDVEIVRHGI